MNDGPDYRQQQEQDEEQQWLADKEAQEAYLKWLDEVNERLNELSTTGEKHHGNSGKQVRRQF